MIFISICHFKKKNKQTNTYVLISVLQPQKLNCYIHESDWETLSILLETKTLSFDSFFTSKYPGIDGFCSS